MVYNKHITGGGISNECVEYSVWFYAQVCLFLSLPLEATIEVQQEPRIAYMQICLIYAHHYQII